MLNITLTQNIQITHHVELTLEYIKDFNKNQF